MSTSKLTSKGQITLPKAIRDRLRLRSGDVLEFCFDERGRVVMRPVADSPTGRVAGLLRHLAPEEPVSVEEMRRAVRRRARQNKGGAGE